MTNKDLSPKEHIIFFSKEEWDQGYKYCNEIYKSITRQFPDHTFIGIPDTVIVKDMSDEEIKEIIELLESYLSDEQLRTLYSQDTPEGESNI